MVDYRVYGSQGPPVIIVHGGPGIAGYLAPVCRELSDCFRVFEPLQRMSEGEPLTVAQHVRDLHETVIHSCAQSRPALVGHSWGAMLVLAYAAAHPGIAQSLVLIGCGTFDAASREMFRGNVDRRMTPVQRAHLRRMSRTIRDPDVRMCAVGRLLESAYSYDLVPHRDETEYYDSRGHEESWADMMRLQSEGVYPAAFSQIGAPVLMLHGLHDPHPGSSIYEALAHVIPQIEYVPLQWCGHYPWHERHAGAEFYELLQQWLCWHRT